MAKKNAREDPPKPQVSENEQMSDIVFILDKMELILEAVSQIGQDGKFNTVAADRQNRNSFLKIDRYADAFENFIKNFWSQLKDPTRFGILSVKEDRLDDPAVQQAIEDIAAGKKTKAVEEFLKQYEIVPRNKENQSINQKNQEEMAKKNETQPSVSGRYLPACKNRIRQNRTLPGREAGYCHICAGFQRHLSEKCFSMPFQTD